MAHSWEGDPIVILLTLQMSKHRHTDFTNLPKAMQIVSGRHRIQSQANTTWSRLGVESNEQNNMTNKIETETRVQGTFTQLLGGKGIGELHERRWRDSAKKITYEVCPEDIQPCDMKNTGIYWRYKIQEILYTGQWCLSRLQSRHLGTSHSFLITISCPNVFSWISSMVWISSLSKVISVSGKAKSHRAPNLGCRGTESPGWFHVLPKISGWDKMHEQVCCHDEAANHQLPRAVAFWITQIVSIEEWSSLTQNLMQICCFTRSVILNLTTTQYTCSLNSIYHPH